MPKINELTTNEAHRIAQQETIKDEIRHDVQGEISTYASEPLPKEAEKAANLGQELRDQAFDEVAATESEISRARAAARVSQIVDFIFYIIYSLIGLQILLDLMGARRGNSFRSMIDTLTSPILSPFESLIQSISAGRYQLQLSYLVALIVYILIHVGINSILRMFVERKTTI
jgi:uncharacterized protein YggT (Ycf19 family)